jgi:two-component system OmpR family response regulator
MRVLIVEDDEVLADGVSSVIEQLGHETVIVRDGLEASRLVEGETFTLVLLDIGVPGIDGLEVLRRLRRQDALTPVMLLTARDGIGDRITGLDLGADDYLVKPVALRELAARVRAMLRRAQVSISSELSHGPLKLDTASRRATLAGNVLELTAREWHILEYLMRRPERVVSKEQIYTAAIGDGESQYNAVEVYISRLRSKLDPAGVKIRTVRGFGYMLEDELPPQKT